MDGARKKLSSETWKILGDLFGIGRKDAGRIEKTLEETRKRTRKGKWKVLNNE